MSQENALRPVYSVSRAARNATGRTGADTISGTLGLWLGRRRQRRALARLDGHLLDDIGVTEEQAEQERKKHFWQA